MAEIWCVLAATNRFGRPLHVSQGATSGDLLVLTFIGGLLTFIGDDV